MRHIIILGMNFQGLFFLRELAKKRYNLHCIGRNQEEIGMYSRYGKKYVAANGMALRQVVKEIVAGSQDKKPIGLFGSGHYLDLVLAEFPEIFQMVDIVGPELAVLRMLNSKSTAYEGLIAAGLSVPKTYSFQELSQGLVSFPLIAKWITKEFYEDSIGKTKVISDSDMFEQFWKSVEQEGRSEHIICQEYISGTYIQELGYGAYYERGSEIASMVFSLKRQYPRGISTYAREVKNELSDHASAHIRKFLSGLNYSGFIEVDFLVDYQSARYYILDINPRPWGSIKFFKKRFPNIVDYVIGENISIEERHLGRPAAFARVFYDFMAILMEFRRRKSLSVLGEAFRDYAGSCLVVDEFDVNDWRPIWGCIKKGLKSVWKKRIHW